MTNHPDRLDFPYGCLPDTSGQPGEEVRDACATELEKGERKGDVENAFLAIADLVLFCDFLTKPENHIKVPTGQYVDKPVNTRAVVDMTNEMAQEMLNLPRFTAYAKIVKGNHALKTKIKTFSLDKLENPAERLTLMSRALERTQELYCQKRAEIDRDALFRRQTRSDGSDEPPATSR